MLFRKPLIFFIKLFKPIHIIMAFLTAYLIYLENNILQFLNTYLHTNINVVGEELSNRLINNFIFIIPIILIILSLLILGIMFKKQKPIKFYFVNIIAFIAVIVVNVYTSSFISVLEESIVSIKSVKLIHDLIVINIGIESVSLLFLIVRGTGVNFKKFDFSSELSKFELSESDKEVLELDIIVDINEKKRIRKNRLRKIKYFYIENKFIINISIVIFIIVGSFLSYFIITAINNNNIEGVLYKTSRFNFKVDETLVLNTDYRGNKITDNYLVIVNASMNSNYSSVSLYPRDFSLIIGDAVIKPTTKYAPYLVDIGSVYNQNILTNEYDNYLFVYEIPEKYIESDMYFGYNEQGRNIEIKLNPTNLVTNELILSKSIGEEMSFVDVIGDIKFKIQGYEISNRFLIEYNYCIEKNDCLLSKEYLKPSIDENFDKIILKLNVEYSNNSDLKMSNFYEIFNKFGTIQYKIGEEWYYQNGDFEEIKSSRVKNKNITYVGIDSRVINATSIKMVFNIRGSKYEYILKQVEDE